MKFQLVLLAALVAVALAEKDKYTDKFDNVDIDQILASNRLLTNYFKCLMETGSCTADGRELKKTLPDALKNDCSKCSETQKRQSVKVIEHLRTKRKDLWEPLVRKYDPEGKYVARLDKKN